MKKLIALLLAALMLVTLLTACAKPENDEPQEEETENEETETEETEDEESTVEDPTMDQPATMPEDPTMDQPATMPEAGEPTPDMSLTPDVGEPTVDADLQALLADIYAIQAPEFMTAEIPFSLDDPEALVYYTGLTDTSLITGACVSESAMGSQAYSLVLVRVADAAKLSEVADAMESGIDTRKWVCVEADDLRVVGAGDVVMLIMVESSFAPALTADGMVDAFQQAIGLDLEVE